MTYLNHIDDLDILQDSIHAVAQLIDIASQALTGGDSGMHIS
jgi:hypothetical protein